MQRPVKYLALLAVLLLPSTVFAQATLTGTVRDNSGGVLPGVTVEASSPVLIEKVKTAVTDDAGVYRIVDLRAGTYTLTFTLPGFAPVKRTDIQLAGTQVATLTRENRWQAMARAALRDDLFSLHADLTADVLRGAGSEAVDAEARLDAWIEANRLLVDRCLGILADIRMGGTYDLTTLPVALREVRNLLQASAASVSGPA